MNETRDALKRAIESAANERFQKTTLGVVNDALNKELMDSHNLLIKSGYEFDFDLNPQRSVPTMTRSTSDDDPLRTSEAYLIEAVKLASSKDRVQIFFKFSFERP